MVEELRFHMEARAADLERSGMEAREAQRQARIEFGGVESYKERCRDVRGWRIVDEAWRDLRYAVRGLRKAPVFGFTVIATVALGIGPGTAIFSAVKGVLLNQLPYGDPSRLVALGESDAGETRAGTIGFETVYDWRRLSHSFDGMSLYRDAAAALADPSGAEMLRGLRVNYDFFDTLGIRVALGRTFLPEEDTPDRRREVILSHELWTRRFGADPAILGRTIRFSETPFVVVGVLPGGFQPLEIPAMGKPEFFMPLGYAPGEPFACRDCQHLRLIARVKRGIAVERAHAELDTIMAGLVRQYPASYPPRAAVAFEPLRQNIVGTAGRALWMLLGAVGLVWLMVCANVANLMLARGSGRTREMTLRAALGASRDRLMRQLMVESLLLALSGGAVGLMLAGFCVKALRSLAPQQIPRLQEIQIDGGVMWFALASSLLTAILFGVAPALRAGRADAKAASADSARTTADGGRVRFRSALVMVELALAFILVSGAGLLGSSFVRLLGVDMGFDPRHVVTLRSFVYGERYKQPEAELRYYEQALDRVRALPGVEAAAMVSVLPLGDFDRAGFHIRDRRPARISEVPSADRYSISPDYFRVMKIPILRGRAFTAQDTAAAPRVAIIDQTCARDEFAGRDPIGKQIQLGGRDDSKPWMTIVGISGDVRQYGLEMAPRLAAYIPQAQDITFGFSAVVRTAGDAESNQKAVVAAFESVDRSLPVSQVRPMESYLAASLAERRFTLILIVMFGGLALVLSGVGIYGVVSYAVTARTREMGIRAALGARRSDLLGMVMTEAGVMTAVGLGTGAVGALALTRLLTSLLYETRPTDLRVWTGTVAVLALVALCASLLPARRAAAADPSAALRMD